MTSPLHQYASAPIAADATSTFGRLSADVEGRVAAATADALRAIAVRTERWGLPGTALPAVTGRLTGSDEIGAAEVGWSGDEQATGWPALTARLLVAPDDGGGSRLMLLSPRSPRAELATRRVERLHRRRIVNVALQRFLHDLALAIGGPPVADRTAGVAAFVRRPMFVHALEHLDVDAGTARDLLLRQLGRLAPRSTEQAIERAGDDLAAGRFRAPARPEVTAWPARPDEPATAWIRWASDEEATGWPAATLGLLLEARGSGSRLAVLSPREPRYDLSRNRIDRAQRDRILRQAGRGLAAAIAGGLSAPPTSSPVDRRDLALSAR